jgi:hypothetical protein
MQKTLSELLAELDRKKAMELRGEWLPDSSVVTRIGELGDPTAVSALERALDRAKKFKALCETAQIAMSPTEPGSASPILAAALANQTISDIEKALEKCQE